MRAISTYLMAAILAVGLTAPAFAMGGTQDMVKPGNQPVPDAEFAALKAEAQTAYGCKGGTVLDANLGDFRALDVAMSNATLAAKPAMNNYPRFLVEKVKVEAEVSRLTAKYGC